MKNIWTQHLERSGTKDSDKGIAFTEMLHSLVRTGINTDNPASTTFFLSGNITSNDLSYSLKEGKNIASVKKDRKPVLSGGIKTSYPAETEIVVWTAKSQKGYELGLESLSKDYVRLLMAEDGHFFLRYDVAGESPFEMTVKSENEAMQIIEEDNLTTEQLYPENPELKWIKITLL
ncbi:hypothetical protein RE476_00585 [Methanolobus mangrovi]|uniref:Uncharacterized protein n=1 Tax=Methanolobus mangrovi TaxID=3072977 RepID=A0AA51UFR4_9EURY|nr:hypothetical protein [Methanolobus mangrovi]WMW22348.1 hypothetical protein RE476_00585 [Methanolobus mangrovi]